MFSSKLNDYGSSIVIVDHMIAKVVDSLFDLNLSYNPRLIYQHHISMIVELYKTIAKKVGIGSKIV